MTDDALAVAALVLRAATQIVDRISAEMADRGYAAVRPAHGFAFVRIAAEDATVADVAAHLGVTKQAASQLVEQLVSLGYVVREPKPGDARAKLLRLTAAGRACTRAAEAAAAAEITAWREQVGAEEVHRLRRSLERVVAPGPLRPAW